MLKPGDDYSRELPRPAPVIRRLPGGGGGGQPSGGSGLAAPAEGRGSTGQKGTSGGCGSHPSPDDVGTARGGDVSFGGRKRPTARKKRPGLADWIYWYEVNREEYEDLRVGAYVTEGNPLFALGGTMGKRAGRVERRLEGTQRDALKAAVRAVLASGQGTSAKKEHWVYTEGAAYIALGKIASTDDEIEFITRALDPRARHTQFVRESAALGLGQLRRGEERRRLPGTSLDRVRKELRRVLGDERYAPRTRAFAAISLGLLADQPSIDQQSVAATSRALTAGWFAKGLPDETQVGVLMGLGLIDPAHVSGSQRLLLQASMRRASAKKGSTSALVRSYAALALGRVGGVTDAAALMQQLADGKGASPTLTQATVIAAGTLAKRHPKLRPALANALLSAYRKAGTPSVKRLTLMSLARLTAAQASSGGALMGKVALLLRTGAAKGSSGDRAFGALALAVAVRAVDESVSHEGWQQLRGTALETLREGLVDRKLDGHARAAFATGLGIAKDTASSKALLTQLVEADNDPDLRAHAALGLGLLGEARGEVVGALASSLKDARSDQLRMRSVTALGLLGGGSAKDRDRTLSILLAELKKTRNQNVKGQIVITLARIGDARAVKPLIDVLQASRETHMNRSMACAALGLMGDEERTPVLSAARRDSHYMGGSAVLFEVLDVL